MIPNTLKRTLLAKIHIRFAKIHLRTLCGIIWTALFFSQGVNAQSPDMKNRALKASILNTQPMTGIVLWTTHEAVATSPIQLEYSYFTYSQVVDEKAQYDWSALERMLEQIASRGHQAVLRFHDTYVGKKTGVPECITALPDYQTTQGESEGKPTEFPDWAHPELQRFAMEFFDRFAERYDRDPRIAFVQVGFGLWAEYHIYDGPMILGKTFPSKEYQSEFAQHLSQVFKQTKWMISVDAADNESTPFEENPKMLKLPFGLFDDSFNHKQHAKENEPNWIVFGRDRWKRSPMGGEFSFFAKLDQTKALAPNGPYGIPFEKQAAKFHISFMIGDSQPEYQPAERILSASQACGYRFHVTQLKSNDKESFVSVTNRGIAPIYYDAHVSIQGVRSVESLKGLLPGESRSFTIKKGGSAPQPSIECDRLVLGQSIQYEADLKD